MLSRLLYKKQQRATVKDVNKYLLDTTNRKSILQSQKNSPHRNEDDKLKWLSGTFIKSQLDDSLYKQQVLNSIDKYLDSNIKKGSSSQKNTINPEE
mmetsp:Transcript_10089/g.10039  ORF Transcript_10089/g.10039 Transcript_10089/m.10039 type:complete len:96 (-) Transcript_10089:255-542(-)